MDAIPEQWIDKLFNCMDLFYGNRWKQQFEKLHTETFYKTLWKNGLTGLSYNEIKSALILYKRAANDSISFPPNVMEFYRVAKGQSIPFINYKPSIEKPIDLKIQQEHMAKIRKQLSMKARLSTYGQLIK